MDIVVFFCYINRLSKGTVPMIAAYVGVISPWAVDLIYHLWRREAR